MRILFKLSFPALALLMLVIGCRAVAQEREMLSWEKTQNGLKINCNDGLLELVFFTGDVVECSFIPQGYENPPSFAIDAKPEDIRIKIEENDNGLRLISSGLNLEINEKPLQIKYLYDDQPLFEEEAGYFENDSLKGFRMKVGKDEKLLGGGSRVLGMDRRGNRLKLYNRASYGYGLHADLMYYSMPLMISSRKYMIVFDNAASGFMDLAASEKDILSFEAVGGRMSYIVIAADSWPELTKEFTHITGRQPMPARWTLGNIASRMGYHTQKQVEETVAAYKKDEIPLDAIVLDLYWFGPELQGSMGNLEWYRDSFPEPEKMMKKLKSEGVKTILITEPFILTESFNFPITSKLGLLGTKADGSPYTYNFFFGETGLLDIFKAETQDWFWNVYKKHTLSGVAGWWGDLGEPEVHPDDMLHVNGRGDEVHNAYGHFWAKTIYDGYAKDFPLERPLILMRSGFVGSQRYGMMPWTGDVARSWEGLNSQMEISMQMGMQGLAYMSSDLGGFAGAYKDAELYVRWLQYGVFQPIYRTHAQEDVPAEPVFWDEHTKKLAKHAIELRYRLMPYLYTMTWQNATSGMPLMRPLFYMEDDDQLIEEKYSYLWGDAFLVHPVVDQGSKKEKIYLPEHAAWFDFDTDERNEGGRDIKLKTREQSIPVFVKAGAFVPMVRVFETLDKYNSDSLDVHFYYDPAQKTSEGWYYEDDGQTQNAWIEGNCEIIRFLSEAKADGSLVLKMQKPHDGNYSGKPEKRHYQFMIHNWPHQPKEVLVQEDKSKPDFSYDAEKRILKFGVYGEAKEVVVR